MLSSVRARTLLLVGVVLALVGLAGAAVLESTVPSEDNASIAQVALVGITTIALVGVFGFLIGWFGREHDDLVLIVIGSGATLALTLALVSIVSDEWRMPSVLIGVAVAAVAGAFGRMTWWVGNALCDLRGLPTPNTFVPPAYPEECPGITPWTTDAGPALRETLDALAERTAPGAAVDGLAVGILLGLPRDRLMVVALAGDRLALEPVDIAGTSAGPETVIAANELAEVSIRSESRDGNVRRQIHAYRDPIEIRTRSGSRLRFLLPYGTRGAGTSTGGPDVLRAWLRTNAAAYR